MEKIARMWYAAVFFIFSLLYSILFLIETKAEVTYTRNEQEEWVILSFHAFNRLQLYRKKILLVKKHGDQEYFKRVKGQAKEMKSGKRKKEELLPFDILRKYISFRTYLDDHRTVMTDVRRYLNRKDVHVELKIDLLEGTGDAAQTGVICGLLWAAAGILITQLSRHLKAFSKSITIRPFYDKKVFEVKAACIFHVRIVHIIVVLIKIYSKKAMIKAKNKKMTGGVISG